MLQSLSLAGLIYEEKRTIMNGKGSLGINWEVRGSRLLPATFHAGCCWPMGAVGWGTMCFTPSFPCGFTPSLDCQGCLLWVALSHFFLSSFSRTLFPFAFISWIDAHELQVGVWTPSIPSRSLGNSSLCSSPLILKSGHSQRSRLAPLLLQKLILGVGACLVCWGTARSQCVWSS